MPTKLIKILKSSKLFPTYSAFLDLFAKNEDGSQSLREWLSLLYRTACEDMTRWWLKGYPTMLYVLLEADALITSSKRLAFLN